MGTPFLYGIDFCFDPSNPGPADPEGHYALGYGFISRATEQSGWEKVSGFAETVQQNTAFGFQFYDLSKSLTQIDFATVSFRPDPADAGSGVGGAAANPSPFSDDDFELLDAGTKLTEPNLAENSCGCVASGNGFSFGQFTINNPGDYEMTIEIQVTTAAGQKLQFKCDPKMQVGT